MGVGQKYSAVNVCYQLQQCLKNHIPTTQLGCMFKFTLLENNLIKAVKHNSYNNGTP